MLRRFSTISRLILEFSSSQLALYGKPWLSGVSLRTTAAMFAEMLDSSQYWLQLAPKSQIFTNLKASLYWHLFTQEISLVLKFMTFLD
jgi:hypothetical protein